MPSHDNSHGPTRPQTIYLPVPAPKTQPEPPRLTPLRAWWNAAWEEDGVLHGMWEDVCSIPEDGLRHMAPWLRTVVAVAGLSFAVLLAQAAGDVLLQALHQLLTAVPKVQIGVDTSHGVFAVIDQPVRTYIAQHATGLPVQGSTVYTIWQLVGLFGLIGGFARISGARLTWTAWGVASIAMVYSAAPADGRPIATGFAVLAWTAASALALRGLSLRPAFFTHIHNAGHQIKPHIHLPAPAAEAAPDDEDDAAVHSLQKR
ncbi:hypothetical protein ABZW32_14685 [Streptomyces sp. NPDC004667]|uniref:hypothetical protein n=1 Tax=Streptomyces sp. NPDC004667 TaxID=3154285 RepID=UPI00339F4EEF